MYQAWVIRCYSQCSGTKCYGSLSTMITSKREARKYAVLAGWQPIRRVNTLYDCPACREERGN